MASEPHTFIIEADQDFDAVTPFEAKVSDFVTARTNGRVHRIHLAQAVGIIGNSMFQLLSSESVKRVGVASKFNNPLSVLRVVADSDPDRFRREIDLTPEMQYVSLYPGDNLVIKTMDGGRTSITLVVNEMGEADHIGYSIQKRPSLHWRRFRIIRRSPLGFQTGFGQETWRPSFHFDRNTNLVVADEVDKGPIPHDSFCTFPRFAGCLVKARFANVNDEASLHVMEPVTKSHRRIDKVPNMQWTKTAWISHDDHIALRSDAPLADDITVCDLAIARINAELALQGRFDRGL